MLNLEKALFIMFFYNNNKKLKNEYHPKSE